MNFEAVAEACGVRPNVIEALFNDIPFRDSFDVIASSESPEAFWDYVDSLPRCMAMQLHELAAELDVTGSEFPEETTAPIIESFWAANLLARNETPTAMNCQAITQIDETMVSEYLKVSHGWTQVDDSTWKFGELMFTTKNLANACDCFINGGRTWLFCEIQELRTAYASCESQIENLGREAFCVSAKVQKKLRTLSYSSSYEMIEDIGEAGSIEICEFKIPDDLSTSLHGLFEESRSVFDNHVKSPEVGPVSPWVCGHAELLVGQMELPLAQRAAFVLTPQILQARVGMSNDAGFGTPSIEELLFGNSNGEVCPMPFANSKTWLPSTSPAAFCRGVLKRFVANQLKTTGYDTTTESVLDILTDVMGQEIRELAKTTVVVQRGSDESPKVCMEHALKKCGYEAIIPL